MPRAPMPIADAHVLPRWRRPEALLMVMVEASPLAFAIWRTLLNNFVVERAAFDGFDISVLHATRVSTGPLLPLPPGWSIPACRLGRLNR